jgi:hypothetical protein
MPYQLVHPGRAPAPKDLIGRTLFAVGTLLRGVGVAVDELGVFVGGSSTVKDTRERRAGWRMGRAGGARVSGARVL